MQQISAPELQQLLTSKQPRPYLLDVREPWEYDICHLEGSHLIPMGQLPTKLDELPDDQEIVVLCHHGVRSMQVCYFLAHQGFDKLINLTGGIDAWSYQVDPQMAKY